MERQLYRLNRAIAMCGLASRRKADELIASGLVRVNGKKVVDFNTMVDLEQDKLVVDGYKAEPLVLDYIIMNKPKGVVTTCFDDQGRKIVLDLLPPELRHLKPVGRLDTDSEGLLLLTNDGNLAKALTHPSHDVPKLYEVTVKGKVLAEHIETLSSGVRLSEGVTRAARVSKISANSFESTLRIEIFEGRNRQIRRMCAKVGLPVTRLVRVAIGGLQLKHLEPGYWRHLSDNELSSLYRQSSKQQTKK
ncbi:MAG: rRNA pseudouridine synthase [Candidatus Obscuribacter sp.]|nr:rRNA pseudouridine synthase [Candidatus Obscuribacter sp.]MBP6351859.1 rRNA pseudouridine synthase [Candidatus Obscuribacter sp.]MBP6595564.1 rRNA pseudouridine synthase [Candidatus Obscuribacter sp.]MBP7577995.1 rRNA pseudouridine synthase [Candidatus Obscuribacter sp.]